jgi:hypothetical protein
VAHDMPPATTSAVVAITLRKLFMNSSEFFMVDFAGILLTEETYKPQVFIG